MCALSYIQQLVFKKKNHSINRNKLVTEGQIPHNSTCIRYLKQSIIEAENRMVVARNWCGGESGTLLFSRYKVYHAR